MRVIDVLGIFAGDIFAWMQNGEFGAVKKFQHWTPTMIHPQTAYVRSVKEMKEASGQREGLGAEVGFLCEQRKRVEMVGMSFSRCKQVGA